MTTENQDKKKVKFKWGMQLLLTVGGVFLYVVLGSPFFYLGQYESNQENLETITRLKDELKESRALNSYQVGEHGRLLREQRIEIMEEKKQEVDRMMLICSAAAMKSEKASETSLKASESVKGVLDTVKDNNDAQVDAIRNTLEKDKK